MMKKRTFRTLEPQTHRDDMVSGEKFCIPESVVDGDVRVSQVVLDTASDGDSVDIFRVVRRVWSERIAAAEKECLVRLMLVLWT